MPTADQPRRQRSPRRPRHRLPSPDPAHLTLLGPTLPALELAGRKLLALFGRAEARDFADVYRLAQHWSPATLMEQAHDLDPGLDPDVLAQMLATRSRFTDSEIPLPEREVPTAGDFFATWTNQLKVETGRPKPEP